MAKKLKGRGDDGVSGADSGGGHGQPEGVGAAGAADGVGHGAGGRGGVLEAGDLRAEDELLRVADAFDGGKNFLANPGKLAGEIEHRNRLGVVRHVCHGISRKCAMGQASISA